MCARLPEEARLSQGQGMRRLCLCAHLVRLSFPVLMAVDSQHGLLLHMAQPNPKSSSFQQDSCTD